MSLSRLLAYSHRETLELLRDPVRLVFAFAGSILLMLIFGYGISPDIDDIRYAALDLDRTPESRQYLDSISGSRYFLEQPEARSHEELQARLKESDITCAIEIPSQFGRDIKRGRSPEVSVWSGSPARWRRPETSISSRATDTTRASRASMRWCRASRPYSW
jgi:ribosome-dependent ATPase